VVFRGSVTPKDFMQDAKAHFTNIVNPLDLFHGPDEMLIHSGFYGECTKLNNILCSRSFESSQFPTRLPLLQEKIHGIHR
jgi:hypothetical protein